MVVTRRNEESHGIHTNFILSTIKYLISKHEAQAQGIGPNKNSRTMIVLMPWQFTERPSHRFAITSAYSTPNDMLLIVEL
jgi:hypothetical protein